MEHERCRQVAATGYDGGPGIERGADVAQRGETVAGLPVEPAGLGRDRIEDLVGWPDDRVRGNEREIVDDHLNHCWESSCPLR